MELYDYKNMNSAYSLQIAEIAVERVLHLLLTPDSETETLQWKRMILVSVGHSEPVQE